MLPQEIIRRKRDEEDRRNVSVQRTVKGSVYLTDFAAWIKAAEMGSKGEVIKEDIFNFLDEESGDEQMDTSAAA